MSFQLKDLLFTRSWSSMAEKPQPPGITTPSSGHEEKGDGAFISPATAVTYTGSIGIVQVISATASTLNPDLSHKLVIGLASVVVGVLLFTINISAKSFHIPDNKLATWLLIIIVSIANTCILFMASLGMSTALAAPR